MKWKSLRIHGVWALAALAAYGFGSSRPEAQATAGGNGDPSRGAASAAAGSLEGGAPERRQANRRERNPSGPGGSLIGGLFGRFAGSGVGLEALAEQAIRDPNPIARRLAFSKLLEAMTPENAGEIRAQLVELGANGDEWNDFNYSWGALAGMEAINFAASSDEEDLSATMSGWAAARPSEALALLDNLPESMRGQREQLAESIVAGLAATDRGMATQLVMRLAGEGHARADRMMDLVATETLRADGVEVAAAWSLGLPNGPLKGAAMNRVADQLVRKDPEGAARWAQGVAGEDFAASAVARVGGQWAVSNPVAAVGWLETLPAGGGQTEGLRNAFGDWEDRDPVAAGKYLMSMPPSPQRDSSISGFSQGYAWQNPEVAIAWANDISDPGLRQQTLTRAGQAYFQRDPESARAWLETSNLPPEAQQQVLNPRR